MLPVLLSTTSTVARTQHTCVQAGSRKNIKELHHTAAAAHAHFAATSCIANRPSRQAGATAVGLSCRAYQQVDLLNSLQSFMLTPRSPCGHASRVSQALQQQQPVPHLVTDTMNPVVMSYLASSRLTSLPASFAVFGQVSMSVCSVRLYLVGTVRCQHVRPCMAYQL